jgi:hypothetical protein
MKLSLLTAVQLQPITVVTETLPAPPFDGKVELVGLIVHVQTPD